MYLVAPPAFSVMYLLVAACLLIRSGGVLSKDPKYFKTRALMRVMNELNTALIKFRNYSELFKSSSEHTGNFYYPMCCCVPVFFVYDLA